MATSISLPKGASMGLKALRGYHQNQSLNICLRCQISQFSTTSTRSGRNSDRSKMRGVSALRRTGPKQPSAVSREPLPKPVLNPPRPEGYTNPEHGLWQFFDSKKNAFEKPDDVGAHGRAWTVDELRKKSFEDLHCLWWVCCKERNRLYTQEFERKRCRAGFGDGEFEDREATVRKTMKHIRHTLIERWYGWEDARKIAEKDPELQDVLLDRTGIDETLLDFLDKGQAEDLFEEEEEEESEILLDEQQTSENPFPDGKTEIPPEPPVPGPRPTV